MKSIKKGDQVKYINPCYTSIPLGENIGIVQSISKGAYEVSIIIGGLIYVESDILELLT